MKKTFISLAAFLLLLTGTSYAQDLSAERQELLLKVPAGHTLESETAVWEVLITENGPREVISYFHADAVDIIEIEKSDIKKFTRVAVWPSAPGQPPTIIPTIFGETKNGKLTARSSENILSLFEDPNLYSAEILETVVGEIMREAQETLKGFGITTNEGLRGVILRSLGGKQVEI